MRFGMSLGESIGNISIAAKSGFDFIECGFSVFAERDDEFLSEFASELEKNNIRCESANCFLPARLKVTGPDVDYKALSEYIEKGFSRGKKLGLTKVVFGSGGARRVPEGFSFEEAGRQIVYFLKNTVAPLAEKYGIVIVIEPLRKGDTNIINSAKEAMAYVALTGSDNVKCLVDLYHMEESGDNAETVMLLHGSLAHAHVAEPVGRHFPSPDDGCDYKSFIEALIAAGCSTCSVEASTVDFAKDCPQSYLALVK